jgi:dephospho-CoA kinase
MMKWKAEGQKLCFIEGTRLIESGFHNMLAGIIFISAKEDLKIKRVMKRDSMGKDEVTMMIRMQDETLMKRIAKHEWKNDATEAALKKTIQAFVDSRIKQAG